VEIARLWVVLLLLVLPLGEQVQATKYLLAWILELQQEHAFQPRKHFTRMVATIAEDFLYNLEIISLKYLYPEDKNSAGITLPHRNGCFHRIVQISRRCESIVVRLHRPQCFIFLVHDASCQAAVG